MSLTKLVIDRSKWGAGGLLNDDGKMCCLGFASKACGASEDEIGGLAFPPHSFVGKYNMPPWMCCNEKCTDTRCRPAAVLGHAAAAGINDSSIPESEKEERLAKLFAANGIELSFIGVK